MESGTGIHGPGNGESECGEREGDEEDGQCDEQETEETDVNADGGREWIDFTEYSADLELRRSHYLHHHAGFGLCHRRCHDRWGVARCNRVVHL